MTRAVARNTMLAGILAAALIAAPTATATHVQCGDVITQDTTLDSDLVDCTGDGIVIGADNITLDLNGHTVEGDGLSTDTGTCAAGILNGSRQSACLDAVEDGHDGVIVRGGTIRGFALGVLFIRTADSVARDLVVSGNRYQGILVVESRGARIERDRAFDNQSGIRLLESSNGSVTGNDAWHNSSSGIVLEAVDDSRVERNSVTGNERGINLEGGHRNRLAQNRVAGSRVQGI
jgi:parallel beta-helix repeat protein